jgi:hypothetical protein
MENKLQQLQEILKIQPAGNALADVLRSVAAGQLQSPLNLQSLLMERVFTPGPEADDIEEDDLYASASSTAQIMIGAGLFEPVEQPVNHVNISPKANEIIAGLLPTA